MIDESKPPLQADGPLRGLGLVAESTDGSFSDPQLAWTTDDTAVAAVVGLGDDVPEGSTLTVTWYRLTGVDEREHLFTHEIPIGPGGQAFSQGVAEGGLAPGLYETVATLGVRQVRTPWTVRVAVAARAARARAAVAGAYALLSTGTQAQSTLEDWEIPTPGESGWADPEATPASPSPPGPCEIDNIFGGMTPLSDVKGTVFWLGQCSRMTLTATVSGAPQTLASKEIPEGSLAFLRGDADVCELPGGSDMPGTTVRYVATGSEGATGTENYTLPDLGETLTAAIESRPDAGSLVEAGQSIDLHAIGMVMPPALGIEKLSLRAGEEFIDSTGNLSGSAEPRPCDLGRYYANIESVGRYRVPDDPPPVIAICAEALGFDGKESSNCIEFYTGEVWEGSTVWTGSPIGSITYDVRLVVESDGTTSGTLAFVSCSTECGTPPPEIGVAFRKAGDSFAAVTLADIAMRGTIPITGSRASGETTQSIQPYTHRWAWTLECTSCEGAG